METQVSIPPPTGTSDDRGRTATPKRRAAHALAYVAAGVVALVMITLFTLVALIAFASYARKQQVDDWNGTVMKMGEIQYELLLYKMGHHEYPATLRAISGKFATGIPLDLYSGRPFAYTRTPSGFRLTCLGADQTPGGSGVPDQDIIFDERGFPARP